MSTNKDPLQQIGDGVNHAINEVGHAVDQYSSNIGDIVSAGGTGRQRNAAYEARVAADKEAAARTSVYNDAIANTGIDSTTRSEIASLYASGATSATIAAVIAAAGEGKGLYGIRKINAAAAAANAAAPGRAQLYSTTGVSTASTLGVGTSIGGSR